MKKTLFILFCLNFLIPQEVSGYDIIKQMNEKDFSSNIKATLSMKTVNQKGIVKEERLLTAQHPDSERRLGYFFDKFPAAASKLLLL